MTNANFFKTKNVLADLNQGLQSNKLKANSLATHLSPFGLGKQAVVSSAKSLPFRPSV
jgi:hypothetical protein